MTKAIAGHSKRDKTGCDKLFHLLMRTMELEGAAYKIQKALKNVSSKAMMELAKQNTFVKSIYNKYLFEKTNNHVLDAWKIERQKEKEEYERQYREWLLAEEKAWINGLLKDMLRFGWTEGWKEKVKQANNEDDDDDDQYDCENVLSSLNENGDLRGRSVSDDNDGGFVKKTSTKRSWSSDVSIQKERVLVVPYFTN